LERPKQHINESFKDYQKRHFASRGGAGEIPKDEGRLPPKSWKEQAAEVVLSALTAPGFGPAKVLPKGSASGVGRVVPKLTGAGAAPVKPKVAVIKPSDMELFRARQSAAPAVSKGPGGGVKPSPPETGLVKTQDAKAPGFAEIDNEAPYTLPGSTSASGTSDVQGIDWGLYMKEDVLSFDTASDAAFTRQVQLYKKAGLDPFEILDGGSYSDSSSTSSSAAGGAKPDYDLVQLYTQESNEYFNNAFRYDGEAGRVKNPELIGEFSDLVESLPCTEGVTLYRGGSGVRGTSGEMFRSGQIKVGDSLVNADFTSFTENPYLVKDYFGGNVDKTPGGYKYDDTSVVFILEQPKDAHAIAPLSVTPTEVESLYTPGHVFTVKGIDTSNFDGRPLVQVRIAEDDAGSTSGKTFDFRTGKPFDRQAMVNRVGKDYADRFFPRASGSGEAAH